MMTEDVSTSDKFDRGASGVAGLRMYLSKGVAKTRWRGTWTGRLLPD
jgi:hypothetical protein